MKKTVKVVVQVIISLIMAKICIYCGEITGESWSYGVIWAIICTLIFSTKITIETIDDDGHKTTKRIY